MWPAAVEQQHLLGAAEAAPRSAAGPRAILAGGGVEQVEGALAAVRRDRLQVGVLRHRVRMVALDHDEVGGDPVQVSCGHGGHAAGAVSHRSHTTL